MPTLESPVEGATKTGAGEELSDIIRHSRIRALRCLFYVILCACGTTSLVQPHEDPAVQKANTVVSTLRS